MSVSQACAVLTLGTTLLVTAHPKARADETRFQSAVREVLTVGWGTSFRQLEPAKIAYGRALEANPRSALAPFALALVQMKHRRYEDALSSVQAALKIEPAMVSALQADVFLTVLLKQHQAALAKLDRLAKTLVEQAEGRELAEEQLADSARFLGQLFGYLATPAGEAPQLEVAAMQAQLLKRLPPSLYEPFEAGRQAIDEKFTEMFLDREQQQQQAQDVETQQRVNIAEQLLAEKQALEADRAALEQARLAVVKQLEDEEAAVTRAKAPLVEKLSVLQRSLGPLEAQMAQTDIQIGQYLSLAAAERDPQRIRAYRFEADRLTALMIRYQVDHLALRAQAAPLETELAVLDARLKAARDRYASQVKSISNRGVEVVTAEKKLATRWERNQRPVVGNTAAVSSRSAQVKALTTYYTYPLEQERLRVLESLR